jgi:DMSO/TMAO reductase YedYZ molybdopterin-dependent catalytic subunit
MLINDDFIPKRKSDSRLPPGQYETRDFPVLSLGPTPDIDIKNWKLEVTGLVEKPMSWTWEDINKLPKTEVKKDIHCVTKWSKFDTNWEGISLDHIIDLVKVSETATHLIAHSYDGYTTNIPMEDITNGQAWVATAYEGDTIEDAHGGPARLLVPHLYFWKSAKWLNKLEFVDADKPGFWETRGYHNYGDPWKEQRYTFD